MKKISIILNSRDRPVLLGNLLKSIEQNTANLNNIEVLISCDDDDNKTLEFLQFEVDGPIADCVQVEWLPRERNLHKRLNNLAKEASGKYIFVLNDDCEIVTPNWDTIIFETMDAFGGILYGRPRDNSCDKEYHAQYASFPVISKEAVEKMGCFMPDICVGLGGDVLAFRIFNEINRIVDLDIDIRHILHETVDLVLNPDETAAAMRANTYANPVNFWSVDLSEYVNKLK